MPGALTASVAQILADAFRRSAMSQASFGALVNISQSQFSKYMRGEVALNLDQFDAICRELGLSVVEVIEAADFARRDALGR